MRKGQPSRTSSLVALLRALSHEGLTEVRGFGDPTALVFLSSFWRWVYRRTLRSVARRPDGRQRMLERARGRIDLIALRTRFFDEPFRGEMTRATAAERLSLAGLRVVEDTGSAEWRRLCANPQANVSDVIRERIAVAEL